MVQEEIKFIVAPKKPCEKEMKTPDSCPPHRKDRMIEMLLIGPVYIEKEKRDKK